MPPGLRRLLPTARRNTPAHCGGMGFAAGGTGRAAPGAASGNRPGHRRVGRAVIAPHRLPAVGPGGGSLSGLCPPPGGLPHYGFYVQRDQGLYCKDIESRVAGGALAEVVWGNHDAIDRRLGGLGDTRDLTEWFARWKEGGDMA